MPIAASIDEIPDNAGPRCAALDSLYHVTVLSNFVRGYDKYARVYDKSKILESTYPGKFFLLSPEEIDIGIRKASTLLRKTGLAGDHLIALETQVDGDQLQPNLLNGRGRYVERGWIKVTAVYLVDERGSLVNLRVEELCALSVGLHLKGKTTFEQLIPRSLSILPVARACQANCPFCFSKASASVEIKAEPIDWRRVTEVLKQAQVRGASRVVITGGGEPSILGDSELDRLIRESASVFSKVVLITNGYKWGRMSEEECALALERLDFIGLSVMAISRHHFDPERNSAIMKLSTRSEAVAATWTRMGSSLSRLKLRWICVLQRGGIEDRDSLVKYLDWAVETGVQEICFKELYVSSSVESEYYDRSANDWSAENQVSLSLVLDLARDTGWELVEKLAWGVPIFEARWRGKHLRVAAYTEPALFWELTHGICRSWNLMADGRCLASLEDSGSEVSIGGLRILQTVS
jgi:molybdenum cofactor biosynthesis enzyme MoaA